MIDVVWSFEFFYIEKQWKKLNFCIEKFKILYRKWLLLDAEEKQVGSHAVRNWLGKLEDVMYDADDLLDDFSTEALLREMMTRDKMAKEVLLTPS